MRTMRTAFLLALLLLPGYAVASDPMEGELPTTFPDGTEGEKVKMGLNIFKETKKYAPEFVGNELACRNCHLGVGTTPKAAPLTGVTAAFPEYSERAGRKITLQERINGCFLRSMNGKAAPLDHPKMEALVAFIGWIADPATKAGRGIPSVGEGIVGDPKRGKELYADNCSACHGDNGEGTKEGDTYTFPPLWGAESFNDGAGMNRIHYAGPFIKWNMPFGDGDSLTPQEAYDIGSFVIGQKRPKFVEEK